MGLSRVGLIAMVALGIVVASLVADAQRPAKIARIGHLRSDSTADAARYGEAFRQGLRHFGYIGSQNITIETQAAEGNYDRLPDLAAELVRLQVDVRQTGKDEDQTLRSSKGLGTPWPPC